MKELESQRLLQMGMVSGVFICGHLVSLSRGFSFTSFPALGSSHLWDVSPIEGTQGSEEVLDPESHGGDLGRQLSG